MFSRARSVVSYANVVATLALFVALGGTGYALVVNGAVVQDESLTGADVMNGSLEGADVGDNKLTGDDIVESSLGAFPVRGYVVTSDAQVGEADQTVGSTANCPAGKRAVGGHVFANRNEPSSSGGTLISQPSFQVRSMGVTNDGASYGASLQFAEPLPPGGLYRVFVRAVCVDAG